MLAITYFIVCYSLAVTVNYCVIEFINELEDVKDAFIFLRSDPQPLCIPECEG